MRYVPHRGRDSCPLGRIERFFVSHFSPHVRRALTVNGYIIFFFCVFDRHVITAPTKMQGLSLGDLKKHPSLVPLFACFFAGALGAGFYLLRLATRNPDVSWLNKKNPEPWQEYANKQYKFYSPNIDYSKIECPAPKY